MQKMAEYKLNDEDFMISLQVMCLHLSINIKEMADIWNTKIYTIYNNNIGNSLQSAANPIFRETYFKFNNETYKQVNSMFMGSPISNVVTKWKMRLIKNTA